MSGSGKDPRFSHLDAAARNGGVPPAAIAADYLTTQARTFTRSHGAIPEIDATRWRLVVDGLVQRSLELSLDDLLTRFPLRDLTAALVCAGLRRRELLHLGPLVGELPWGGEAVANARWRGVSLADVLVEAGVAPTARHAVLIGLDCVERHGEHFGFGGSIPIEKALEPDVLLAVQLDGRALPPEHGFPVRLVVPGWIGARSVKWLGRVELSAVPSSNYFRTSAYRIQRTVDPANPGDVTMGDVLEAIALNSMIVTPEDGAELPAGVISISGWAIGPNAEPAPRVEVSADGGETWTDAAIQSAADRWTWRLWYTTLQLTPGPHELVVRAWDQTGRTQPRELGDVWNVKGYVNNAWHRVRITIAP